MEGGESVANAPRLTELDARRRHEEVVHTASASRRGTATELLTAQGQSDSPLRGRVSHSSSVPTQEFFSCPSKREVRGAGALDDVLHLGVCLGATSQAYVHCGAAWTRPNLLRFPALHPPLVDGNSSQDRRRLRRFLQWFCLFRRFLRRFLLATLLAPDWSTSAAAAEEAITSASR